MIFYVAGGSCELETCAYWIARLKEIGHSISSDWTENVRRVGEANPPNAEHVDRLRWSGENLLGVETADIVWLLIPMTPSIGCWIELGYAISTRRYVKYGRATLIVSGEWRKSTLTSLANQRFETHEGAFSWIVGGHRS